MKLIITLKSLCLVSIGLLKVSDFLDVPRNNVPSIQIPYDPSDDPNTKVSRSQRMKNELSPDHLNCSNSKEL